jgi:hypothetical protein
MSRVFSFDFKQYKQNQFSGWDASIWIVADLHCTHMRLKTPIYYLVMPQMTYHLKVQCLIEAYCRNVLNTVKSEKEALLFISNSPKQSSLSVPISFPHLIETQLYLFMLIISSTLKAYLRFFMQRVRLLSFPGYCVYSNEWLLSTSLSFYSHCLLFVVFYNYAMVK